MSLHGRQKSRRLGGQLQRRARTAIPIVDQLDQACPARADDRDLRQREDAVEQDQGKDDGDFRKHGLDCTVRRWRPNFTVELCGVQRGWTRRL
jgi:hypothetical protein